MTGYRIVRNPALDAPEPVELEFARGSAGTHWRWFNYGVEALRNMVHAAAENTSTLAAMTGGALISTP
jgi:hypothetical protein